MNHDVLFYRHIFEKERRNKIIWSFDILFDILRKKKNLKHLRQISF